MRGRQESFFKYNIPMKIFFIQIIILFLKK